MGLFRILAQVTIDPKELNIPQQENLDQTTVTKVLSLAFALIGAISFLIIIVSGMRYSLSRGESDAVKKAKDSIIYAAVGLVLSMMAFAIVRFVVRNV